MFFKKKSKINNLSASKILNNEDLKSKIEEYQLLLREKTDEKYRCQFSTIIIFGKNCVTRHDVYHVFSDEQGYHFVYYERGEDGYHRVSVELLDIIFWVLQRAIKDMAGCYELDNRDSDFCIKRIDTRRVMFEKELELWGILGEEFQKKAKLEISEILKNAPYSDNLQDDE